MWFVEALLIFSAVYVASRAAIGPARLEKPRLFPSNAVLAISVLGTGAAALLLRLRWPVGAEFLALQFGFFASYSPRGCLGAKGRWLETVPTNQLITWRRVSLYAALGFPVGLVVAAHASNDGQASSAGRLEPHRRHLCFLGAPVRLGRYSDAARLLPTPFRRLRPSLAKIWPDAPISSTSSSRRSSSGCLWRCAHSRRRVGQIRARGTGACVLCFLAAGALLTISVVRRIV
jgi:hypothetical protein